MTSPQRQVLVVIVNYRSTDYCLACLESLARERIPLPSLRVTVVDNASGDDSVQKLQEFISQKSWQDWIDVVDHPENKGFGAGNNVALRKDLLSTSPADYYLLLNPDTEVCPTAIAELLQFMEKNPQASILGPRTESTPGLVDPSAFRFPSLGSDIRGGLRLGFLDRIMKRWILAPTPQNKAHRCDWISGGCMLIRRKVFEQIGFFDEKIFLYFEETDLCHRAAKLAIQTWYVPTAVIMHWAGGSTGIVMDDRLPKPMPCWWFASRSRYLRKNHGRLYVNLCNYAFICGRALWQLRVWISQKKVKDHPHFLRDFFRFNILGQRW